MESLFQLTFGPSGCWLIGKVMTGMVGDGGRKIERGNSRFAIIIESLK